MSLQEALSDIQEDIVNVDISGIIATEELVVNTETVNSSNKYTLDKEVLNKFTTLCNLVFMKRTIDNSVKVDRSLAMEVFTMLSHSKTETAKLTTYPSTINKEVVSEVVSDIPTVIPDEVLNVLQDTNRLLHELLINKDSLIDVSRAYLGKYAGNTERLNNTPPMIIDSITKKSINLLKEPINNIHSIGVIEFEKYKDVLIPMYTDICSNKLLLELSSNKDLYSLSLSEIVDILADSLKYVKSEIFNLQEVTKGIESILETEDKSINSSRTELIDSVDSVIFVINRINAIKDELDSENGLYSKVDRLLDFLV